MKKTIITTVLAIMTLFNFGQENNNIGVETKKAIDSIYNSLIKKHEIAGTSIAIVDNGKIVYSKGYGFTNLEDSVRTTDQSIFRIGSCTKSFTALSIMKLQDEGKLSVYNSIRNYIPELKMIDRFENKNELKIKEILSHTSGLPGDILNGSFCDNPPQTSWTIEQLNQVTFATPNGYQLGYSNVGYELLGETISRLSNQSYSDYLKTNVFNPLNMNSTFVKGGENPIGYVEGKKIMEPQIRDQSAGLIHSNAVDMGNYLIMLLNDGKFNVKSIVSVASIQEMEKNQTENLIFGTSSQWGYGLYKKSVNVIKDNDTTSAVMIGHGGDTWAFHADFKYIPELEVGAIVLTNTDKGTRIASASYLLKKYLKLEQGKSVKSISNKKNDKKSKEKVPTADEVRGFYALGPYTMDVEDTDKLVVKMGFGRVVLKPKNDSMMYTGKINLLGFIPIKLKRQEFQFVKFNDEIFLKNTDVNTQRGFYESKKLDGKEIPVSWKEALGKYESINDFACEECPSKLERSKLKIKEKNGILFFEVETTSWVEGFSHLEVISDELAVTAGIGRGSGETIKILENGNILYSGYEFKRK